MDKLALMRAQVAVIRYLRVLQGACYNLVMKLRSLGGGEARAIVTFETRFWFQINPVQGRDGFLFHRDHDALEQFAADIVLRRRQIDVWIRALKSRQGWCALHGSVMRVLIIPEKHVVYEDKLPPFHSISAGRAAVQLLAAANREMDVPILYPIEELRAASATKPTFFKTDTHWNAYGAFVAYRALVDSLAPEIEMESVREDELAWKERPYVGDLGVRFEHERGETMPFAEPTSNYRMVYGNKSFGRGAVHVYENERRDLPTCVLFRDSFSNFLIPHLMRGFSRLVAFSSLSCHYDLLAREKPDVVLFVTIERFLATFGKGVTIELPEDELAGSFEASAGVALEALESAAG